MVQDVNLLTAGFWRDCNYLEYLISGCGWLCIRLDNFIMLVKKLYIYFLETEVKQCIYINTNFLQHSQQPP